jgi:hypothetical protein
MSIINENAPRYRSSPKSVKSLKLTELVEVTGYSRKHLAMLLRNAGKVTFTPHGVRVIADPYVTFVSRRGRKKVYPEELTSYLKALWMLSGCISSKHLAVFIRTNQDFIFNSPKLKGISLELKEMLLTISPATIERRLAPARKKEELKGRYKTNPNASNIKKRIPVQTHFDKPRDRFGLVEIDLVFHCGVSTAGDFAYTLTATEITTGWTELRVIQNRAQVWSVGALKEIVDSLGFNVIAIHSDNGSEFINAHLERFCNERGITFTRSRAYRKNDAPYVESKNWSMVRVYTGYRRYNTCEERRILRAMMRLVSLKHNLFIPTMKLVSKRREGTKVHKRYTVQTPFARLLDLNDLNDTQKARLDRMRECCSYFRLIEAIAKLAEKLDHAYNNKYHPMEAA